ncbi:hypothetical protein SAMN05421733_10443 [Acinetobacter boissieri]|uniref:Uncharacterized protein n=1 Tax=Acinetobacter boissieri TaxID=1219383 RepID=A0A1G6H630_9GAMM|nr:hypothetical protein SAMN05421733_10443 [Acinetobacter boissieri]
MFVEKTNVSKYIEKLTQTTKILKYKLKTDT